MSWNSDPPASVSWVYCYRNLPKYIWDHQTQSTQVAFELFGLEGFPQPSDLLRGEMQTCGGQAQEIPTP